jgi:hypothetical protein
LTVGARRGGNRAPAMEPMRVLLLGTPFDARARLDGARLAIAELTRAFAAAGTVEPQVLVRDGQPPVGARAIAISSSALSAVIAAIARADVDLVHAMFAPRLATGVVLAALARLRRWPLVHTVASAPRRWAGAAVALAGRTVVPTSLASRRALAAHRIVAEAPIAMPFSPPALTRDAVGAVAERTGRETLLAVSDFEFGGGLVALTEAFAAAAFPHGARPKLLLAGRAKTPRARAIAERVVRTRMPPGRSVALLGEVDSLLPYLAAARAVVHFARDSFAKLDHPRALLEALSIGTPCVVGDAACLEELAGAGLATFVRDEHALADAMVEAFVGARNVDPTAVARLLEARAPSAIAEAYRSLYARAITERSSPDPRASRPSRR